MELNYCRRCGHELEPKGGAAYGCDNGHMIFANAAPAMGVLLVNDRREVILTVRGVDPGKGKYDMAGGFCEPNESLEEAAARELQEELGLAPGDYGPLHYVMSHPEPYDFGGETNTVLGVVYWAKLKPGVRLRAGDDAAGVVTLAATEIDFTKVAFRGEEMALRRLIEMGVI